MKRVSVLLAVHNGAAYIEEAIESVLRQTHGEWELIVASDGSTDDTVSLAQRLATGDSRIRVLELAKHGKNAAYNAAYAASSGDCICYFAADDRLAPTSLAERLTATVTAGPRGYSTCCLRTFSDDRRYDGLQFPRDCRKPNYSGGVLMFSRELADLVFPLPESQPNEDTWTALHLRAFGEHRHVPRPLYLYRIHPGNSYGYSLSFADKRNRYLQRMHAYELFYERHSGARLPFVEREVMPFLEGLRAAGDRSIARIARVRGLSVASKLVLVLYCSPLLYTIRHAFFRALSGGVAR